MNAEIIKAINKKNKKHPFRKWWNKNGYKVMRVIFFPIWIGIVAKNKINKYLISRQEWSNERAEQILNIIFLAEPTGAKKIKHFVSMIMEWAGAISQRSI